MNSEEFKAWIAQIEKEQHEADKKFKAIMDRFEASIKRMAELVRRDVSRARR